MLPPSGDQVDVASAHPDQGSVRAIVALPMAPRPPGRAHDQQSADSTGNRSCLVGRAELAWPMRTAVTGSPGRMAGERGA